MIRENEVVSQELGTLSLKNRSSVCTMHCALCIVHCVCAYCSLYTVHFELWIVSVHFAYCIGDCVDYTLHFALFIVLFALFIVQSALGLSTVKCALCIAQGALWNLVGSTFFADGTILS